jgi:hypothetical protein
VHDRRTSRTDVIHTGKGGGWGGAGQAGRVPIVAEVVEFSRETGVTSVRVDGRVYLLDKDDIRE